MEHKYPRVFTEPGQTVCWLVHECGNTVYCADNGDRPLWSAEGDLIQEAMDIDCTLFEVFELPETAQRRAEPETLKPLRGHIETIRRDIGHKQRNGKNAQRDQVTLELLQAYESELTK